MSRLDRIQAEGTVSSKGSREGKVSGLIRCADGFKMSVQAGPGLYCEPTSDLYAYGMEGFTSRGYDGPYTHVEVGFPSERPEPWDEWIEYCDNPSKPENTVYAYVPFRMIRALVELHGGEVE